MNNGSVNIVVICSGTLFQSIMATGRYKLQGRNKRGDITLYAEQSYSVAMDACMKNKQYSS